MKSQHCKIGKVRSSTSKSFGLAALEESYKRFVEDAYNLRYSNTSLSDILYYEAAKLKKQIWGIKRLSKRDAAF